LLTVATPAPAPANPTTPPPPIATESALTVALIVESEVAVAVRPPAALT
jgi:hypothetical protein